jgi:hypothetical protein
MSEEMMARNIFSWEHFTIYLSGAIDFDRQGGKSWREQWTEKLLALGLKRHQIFNPCKKPLPANTPFNLDDESHIINHHRQQHEWSDLCKVVDQIAHVDLRLLDHSDLVLVNFPCIGQTCLEPVMMAMDANLESLLSIAQSSSDGPAIREIVHKIVHAFTQTLDITRGQRVPTYGTMHEIVEARRQRKPVYIVWEGGKETCSGWLMWLVGHQNVFGTFDELLTRLDNIAKGKAAYNAKDWLLLDLDGDGIV